MDRHRHPAEDDPRSAAPRRRALSSSAPGTDLVTVLIPARNEEAFIGDCLASIRNQTYTNLDIVVVDGESTDRTRAVVADAASADRRVRIVENPRRIIPAALNAGLAAAKGRWLVRVDAHSTVPPDYVATAVARLRDGDWGGVGGRKDAVGVTPAGVAIAAALASPFGVGNSVYHHGESRQVVDHVPFGAYATEVARRIGGWDERLEANEDFEFDWRIRQSGKLLLFDPALRIDWVCRQSIDALYGQYFRYGKGKAAVAKLHPKSLGLRHLAPPVLVVVLAASVLAALVTRRAISLAPIALYGAGLALAAVWTARRVAPGARRYLVPAFASMHVAWGVGFWRGLLPARPRRR